MLGLYAVAFGAYLAALLGLDANGPWRRVLAGAAVLCFAGLNFAGAQVVGRAESVMVYFKLAVLLVFCFGGLAFVDTSRVSPAAFPSAGGIVYAGALIFLGYEGFELIANASEDARRPQRTLPRAYLIAIGGVIALYVLVAFVAVGNLSPHAIATESDYAPGGRRAPVPGLGRLHPDRGRRSRVHLKRDQRHPLRRRQVHLPDGPRRRIARPDSASRSGAARSAACSRRRLAPW